MAKEAILGYLESLAKDGLPIPARDQAGLTIEEFRDLL